MALRISHVSTSRLRPPGLGSPNHVTEKFILCAGQVAGVCFTHAALSVLSIIYSQHILREFFYNLSDFSNILLNSDEDWYAFESELGGSLLQVYDITPERVRMDSTTASSYCGVNPEGLFQWGHSKDHRPDLAQVKIMLSTLDPLGMPIATEILSGEKADDPLYIPAIAHSTFDTKIVRITIYW